MTEPRPIVFISCGQRSDAERTLGTEIGRLIRDLTPFDPYFAEEQTTLEGLTTHILHALNRCVGFIAILHHRGTVSPPGDLIRASVWVEQEIAIAAFLYQMLDRQISFAAYAESGVALEGMRSQLLLNAKEFESNEEVLDHLRLVLPTWQAPVAASHVGGLDVSIAYEEVGIRSERHDYRLVVPLANRGNAAVERYHVDLEFPSALIERPEGHSFYVPDRSTSSCSFFRVTHDNLQRTIYPGDMIRAMEIDYFVDDDIYWQKRGLFREVVRATVHVAGESPKTVEKPIAQLQVF